jgi:hypothetical protein
MTKPIRDNDAKFLEILFKEIRKIDPDVLFEITQYLFAIRVEIQSSEQHRGRIFNKLHHIHKLFGLQFKPSQFIKRDKNLISFDLISD